MYTQYVQKLLLVHIGPFGYISSTIRYHPAVDESYQQHCFHKATARSHGPNWRLYGFNGFILDMTMAQMW